MIKFIGSFDRVEDLPKTKIPEYAFIGRSNVGKSSLLNALVESAVARTSNTPGRTQMINLFEWTPANGGPSVILADLPGYGYAKVSRQDRMNWQKRLEKYLIGRASLVRLFILIDARHGIKDSDLEMMNFCDKAAIQYQLILTKTDKTKQLDGMRRIDELTCIAQNHGACAGNIIATSAAKKFGISDLKKEIQG